MSNLDHGVLRVPLRDAWLDLPGRDDDANAMIADTVARFEFGGDFDAERRLGSALRTVTNVAASLAEGGRRSHALVLSPASGRVEALLSIRVSLSDSEAYEKYLTAARAVTGDERREVLNRVVEEVVLPSGPAILSRDFALPRSDGGVADPAMERVFLALFPTEHDTVAEFTLLTQNLALFVDASTYLMSVASGDDPPLPGMED